MSAKQRERPAGFPANPRRFFSQRHARLHRRTEFDHLLELFRVRECLVHALRVRFKNGLLMNEFCAARNAVLRACHSVERTHTKRRYSSRRSKQYLPAIEHHRTTTDSLIHISSEIHTFYDFRRALQTSSA